MEIHLINDFWLFAWEIVFPIISFLFFIQIMHLGLEWIRQRKLRDEKSKFIQRFEVSSESLPLTRPQILNAIVYMLKTKASYQISTPSGNYDKAADREVLIEYYQDFFKELGFK